MWYRALGVPSYGASASFIKESDEFSHGLNERIPLLNVRPGAIYYLSVLTDLASRQAPSFPSDESAGDSAATFKTWAAT